MSIHRLLLAPLVVFFITASQARSHSIAASCPTFQLERQETPSAQEEINRRGLELAQRLVRKRALEELASDCELGLELLQQAGELRRSFEKTIEKLGASEQGRRIAADPVMLIAYRAQLSLPDFGQQVGPASAVRLQEIASSISKELTEATVYRELTHQERQQVDADVSFARSEIENVRARNAVIQTLTASAKELNPSDSAKLPTLSQALERYDAKLALINAQLLEPIEQEGIRLAARQRALDRAEERLNRVHRETEIVRLKNELAERAEQLEVEQAQARASIQEEDIRARIAGELANHRWELEKELAAQAGLESKREIERDAAVGKLEAELEAYAQIAIDGVDATKKRFELEVAKARESFEQERLKARQELERSQKQTRVLEVKVRLRELPVDVRRRVGLFAEKGSWKPEINNRGGGFKGNGKYSSDINHRQSHSLEALWDCGALEDTAIGQLKLYCVMATRADDRSRLPGSVAVRDVPDQGIFWMAHSEDEAETMLLRDRSSYDVVAEVHSVLRNWGDELVAAGLLEK